jgi:hypothetical protein
MLSAEKLYKAANAPKSKSKLGLKYKLTCQEKINKDTPSTVEWLELINNLDHESDSVKIFEALLNKTKHVIVKVGLGINIVSEYNTGKTLADLIKLPTFLSFYCHFACLDSFKNLASQKGLCGSGNDSISVLVMPFINLGRIDKAKKWTRSNITTYKYILKHVVCTLLYAFETCKFTHNDIHFGNILLKKTKKQEIIYGNHMTLRVIGGYIPVIMDYERAQFTDSPHLLYEDIGKLFNLAGTEIDVKLDIDKRFVAKYITNEQQVSPQVYTEMCNYIDSRDILYVSSEMMAMHK